MSCDHNTDKEAAAAREQIRRAVMTAFCNAIQGTRLPPMAVLGFAAMAVGSAYREVADAHRGQDPCPCGWKPLSATDIEALQAALAAMALPPPVPDLRLVEVAGRA